VSLHLQVWVADGSALHGFAATNGLTGVTQ
jgi:hypothetical protein